MDSKENSYSAHLQHFGMPSMTVEVCCDPKPQSQRNLLDMHFQGYLSIVWNNVGNSGKVQIE